MIIYCHKILFLAIYYWNPTKENTFTNHLLNWWKVMWWVANWIRLMSSICAFSALMLSGGVLAWLSVWSDVHTCIWPSWCHYHSLSLASVKSSLVLSFCYRLTQVVPDKGPLNTCVYVCNVIRRHCKYFGLAVSLNSWRTTRKLMSLRQKTISVKISIYSSLQKQQQ